MLRVFLILCLSIVSSLPASASSRDLVRPKASPVPEAPVVHGAPDGNAIPDTKAIPDAKGISEAEQVAGWLAGRLALTHQQKARVLAILDLERSTQASARTRGVAVQNVPPVEHVRFVPADSQAPVRDRNTHSANHVLREAERREAAKDWLAKAAERTALHPNLVGLRVTALDSMLRLLSNDQAKGFRELLGGQGVEWIRELAAQRLRPGQPTRTAQGRTPKPNRRVAQVNPRAPRSKPRIARGNAGERQAQVRAQSQARATARRQALAATRRRQASSASRRRTRRPARGREF